MKDFCIYCGDFYECRDHVIPVSYQQTYRYYKPGSTVKCCSECNSFLGNRAYHTIESRAKYLISAYIKNRKKDLNFPEWEEKELNLLGYNLRTSTETKLARKLVYQRKIENLELVSNGFECKPFRYELEKFSNTTFESSKKCVNCGSEYFNVNNYDFCSIYCDQNHKAKLVAQFFPDINEEVALNRIWERRCIICDEFLTTNNPRKVFCSIDCQKTLNKMRDIGTKP